MGPLGGTQPKRAQIRRNFSKKQKQSSNVLRTLFGRAIDTGDVVNDAFSVLAITDKNPNDDIMIPPQPSTPTGDDMQELEIKEVQVQNEDDEVDFTAMWCVKCGEISEIPTRQANSWNSAGVQFDCSFIRVDGCKSRLRRRKR